MLPVRGGGTFTAGSMLDTTEGDDGVLGALAIGENSTLDGAINDNSSEDGEDARDNEQLLIEEGEQLGVNDGEKLVFEDSEGLMEDSELLVS